MGGRRWRSRRLRRRASRLEPAGRSPPRGDGRGARAADHGRQRPPAIGDHPRAIPRDRRFGGQCGHRLRRAPASGDPRDGSLPARARHALLGERSVRRIGRLPPPPPDRADHRPWRGPGREHVGDPPRPDLVPGHLLGRGAVPADPAARARGARHVAPTADRRPGGGRVALPARRNRVHHGGGLLRPHADRNGALRAARRLLGRPQAGPRRRQPVAATHHSASAGQSVARRARLRRPGDDRRAVVDVGRPCPRDRPQARLRRQAVLAGDRLRHVHLERLDELDRDQAPRPAGASILGGTLDTIPAAAARTTQQLSCGRCRTCSMSCSARSIRCRSIATRP